MNFWAEGNKMPGGSYITAMCVGGDDGCSLSTQHLLGWCVRVESLRCVTEQNLFLKLSDGPVFCFTV